MTFTGEQMDLGSSSRWHASRRRLTAIACVVSLAVACGGNAEERSGGEDPSNALLNPPRGADGQPEPAAPEPRPVTSPDSSPPPSAPAQPSSAVPPSAVPPPQPPDDTGTPPTEPEPEPATRPEPADPEPEPSSVRIEGCGVIGGFDRVFIFQRDEATGICTDFALVTPSEARPDVFALTNLSMPVSWTVQHMSSFECDAEGNAISGATPTFFKRADGVVAFGALQGALPTSVKLDVLLSAPAEDAATSAEQVIPEQRLVSDDIDLLAGCSLRK